MAQVHNAWSSQTLIPGPAGATVLGLLIFPPRHPGEAERKK
jgi:hypothetical protein